MRVGIFGGGQLGMMLGEAAKKLGIACRCFDSSSDAPAKKVCELIVGSYDDEEAVRDFAEGMNVITYEFENVPTKAIEAVMKDHKVHPPLKALQTAQDRLHEKTLFQKLSIPTPLFADISSKEDLENAVKKIGLPCVLKTRRMGYDGKGQIVLKSNDEIEKAWGAMNNQALILEQFIPFDRELSILAVRTEGGTVSFYPLIENIHRNGILHKSTAPALNTKGPLTDQAQQAAMKIMSELLYVGVLTIEFFEKDGILIANEMAPRVHNSGHWSIEGAVTSQFENHLRAVTGMELGSIEITQPSVMFNIIGSVPDLSSIENNPHIFIHLYGKESRAGRKLGHVTMVSPSEELIARMERILE